MVYRVLRWIARFLFFLGRVKTEGLEKFPMSGPVIVAANHASGWDPVVIAAYLKRPIHYMAKDEFWENKILAKFFESINAFPVKRGVPDRKALRMGLEVLENGEVLGLFPEGTRSKTGEISKPHHGIALFAMKTQALVVPVACIGTKKVFPLSWFSPVKIIYGDPVDYKDYGTKVNTTVLEEISRDIMGRIMNLLQR
ncbi:MAG: lysophospholipid acyltransferase family protein [Chitinophagales bacterium]